MNSHTIAAIGSTVQRQQFGDLVSSPKPSTGLMPPDAEKRTCRKPNSFREWFDAGYRDLIPIVPPGAALHPRSHYSRAPADSIGKQPGIPWDDGRWGALKGWPSIQVDAEKIDEWAGYGASVGLRRGQVLTIDIDATDPVQAEHIESIAIELLGPAPVRIGQAPKRALLYRTASPLQFKKVRFQGADGRIEQVECPAQLVIDGVHAKTGKPYQWPRGRVPFEKLAQIDQDMLDAFNVRLRTALPGVVRADTSDSVERDKIDQNGLRGDPALIERAVAALPNKHEIFGYDEWVSIAAAIRAALPDEQELGCRLFEDFSARTDLLDQEEDPARVYWSLVPPFALGAGYLLDLAAKHSPAGRAVKAELWLEREEDNVVLFPIERAQPAPGAVSPGRKPLVLVGLAEAAEAALTDSVKPLVDGLLDQGAMTVLYGESNSGKTFVAMDIAHAIASGRAWGGMATACGHVIYVSAEGGAALASARRH